LDTAKPATFAAATNIVSGALGSVVVGISGHKARRDVLDSESILAASSDLMPPALATKDGFQGRATRRIDWLAWIE